MDNLSLEADIIEHVVYDGVHVMKKQVDDEFQEDEALWAEVDVDTETADPMQLGV